MQLQRIAIFGPGLIGGSLALAARRHGVCERLSLWSRDPAERAAVLAAGLADEADLVTDDPASAVAGADLVLLCVPPIAMLPLARRIAPHLMPGAAVSDVASVKDGLAGELGAIFQSPATYTAPNNPQPTTHNPQPTTHNPQPTTHNPQPATMGSRYVGAHPMAGGERSGPEAARADLFEGATCLLTPDGNTAPDALEIVETFWRAVGARVRHLTPEVHDESVALISHLPHVLAAALVHFVAAQPVEAASCAGPGWRDVTRIAAGSPELWTEILSLNRLPVTKALHGMVAKLREVLGYLEAGREPELQNFLSEARSQRENVKSRQG